MRPRGVTISPMRDGFLEKGSLPGGRWRRVDIYRYYTYLYNSTILGKWNAGGGGV